jgi:starvation-inducible outer membrane lipoprotein
VKSTLKYLILSSAFALASCASNGHHANKSCAKSSKTETSKKKDGASCKTKKAATKECDSCKT